MCPVQVQYPGCFQQMLDCQPAPHLTLSNMLVRWFNPPRKFCCSLLSTVGWHSVTDKDPFETLGVHRAATKEEIKRAFRQKAKECHPDSFQEQDKQVSQSFPDILRAYQILCDDRQRALHMYRTEQAETKSTSSESNDAHRNVTEEWQTGHDWWWVEAPGTAPQSGMGWLAHQKADLQASFNGALAHAYLGPRLTLEAGELPEAFEAEERRDSCTLDVLHLVSGRTLLGIVRQRQDPLIFGTKPGGCLDHGNSQPPLLLQHPHPDPQLSPNVGVVATSATVLALTGDRRESCENSSSIFRTGLPSGAHPWSPAQPFKDASEAECGSPSLQSDGDRECMLRQTAPGRAQTCASQQQGNRGEEEQHPQMGYRRVQRESRREDTSQIFADARQRTPHCGADSGNQPKSVFGAHQGGRHHAGPEDANASMAMADCGCDDSKRVVSTPEPAIADLEGGRCEFGHGDSEAMHNVPLSGGNYRDGPLNMPEPQVVQGQLEGHYDNRSIAHSRQGMPHCGQDEGALNQDMSSRSCHAGEGLVHKVETPQGEKDRLRPRVGSVNADCLPGMWQHGKDQSSNVTAASQEGLRQQLSSPGSDCAPMPPESSERLGKDCGRGDDASCQVDVGEVSSGVLSQLAPRLRGGGLYAVGNVLEVLIGNTVVATGVAYAERGTASSTNAGFSSGGGVASHNHAPSGRLANSEAAMQGRGASPGKAAKVQAVGIFSPDGQLLAWETKGLLYVGQAALEEAKATHSVLQWGTPLVRHLQFMTQGWTSYWMPSLKMASAPHLPAALAIQYVQGSSPGNFGSCLGASSMDSKATWPPPLPPLQGRIPLSLTV
eukprot:jgi/Botrbrau1/5667/Bobra.0071s0011.3